MGAKISDGVKLDYTPGSDVAVGAVVVIGDKVCIADRPIAANTLGAVAIHGVFNMPKGAGALSQGVTVYWDAATSQVTTTATGNKKAGYVAAAAASGDAEVAVLLGS
jgi:predicted RecA/RadA family phage recombinase